MMGRVSLQGSLLETRFVRQHLVTRRSFYERLADHGHEVVCDDDFVGLYVVGRGRPSVAPSVMVRALLCATHDRTSDRESARRSRVDLDWKAAMGVSDDFEGIAPTTFSLMRSRMVAADADGVLFARTLAKAVAAGVFKAKLTAIIDSSPVHGAGAVAGTYDLIRGFLSKVVRAVGERLDVQTRVMVEPFCGSKPDIDWQDRAARKVHLGELVAAARVVAAEVAGMGDEMVAETVRLLEQVIGQDTESDGAGNLQIRKGVARDRVISHSDPEMRHGRKSASRRFDGHKLDVITDEASELILGVDVRPGNAGDGDGAAPLLSQVQSINGVEVETLLGDMAYSDGDVRVAVEEIGVGLVAKVPPTTNGDRFPKTDFVVDTGTGSVTCPAGQVTTDARATTDHKRRSATLFVFATDVCMACPIRAKCTNANGGRTILVGRHHDRIEAARAAQVEPETKALLRNRSKVERKIDHLQDLGMRKSRYRGKRKTKLQALLAATVSNFKRLAVLDAFTPTHTTTL